MSGAQAGQRSSCGLDPRLRKAQQQHRASWTQCVMAMGLRAGAEGRRLQPATGPLLHLHSTCSLQRRRAFRQQGHLRRLQLRLLQQALT